MNDELWKHLYEIGAVKFGEFTLKSGLKSPYYVDLRVLASHPKVLVEVAKAMADKLKEQDINCLCGIPQAAVPIATVLGVETNTPVVYTRKEPSIYSEMAESLKGALEKGEFTEEQKAGVEKVIGRIEQSGIKGHGISRYVDGDIEDGGKIMMVDDLITSAESKVEAIELVKLEAEKRKIKVNVTGVAVLLDREQGGRESLGERGIKLISVATIREIAESLHKNNILNEDSYNKVVEYTTSFRKEKGLK